MVGARLWSATKWAAYAIAIGIVLGVAMVFIHADWAAGTFCIAPALLGSAGFLIGLLTGGKTPEQLRDRVVQAVQKECRGSQQGLRFLGAQTIPVGPKVTTSEHLTEAVKAHLWRGKARVDCVQAIRIGAPDGEFHLVVPWSGGDMLAHEFFRWMSGRLPGSVALARGVLGSWSSGDWIGPSGSREDPIAQAAEKAGGDLIEGIEWNWEKGRLKIELPWGLQAVPAERDPYVHLMHTAQLGIFRKTFGLDWYVKRRRAFAAFVSTVQQEGKQSSRFPFPANSFIVLQGLVVEEAPEVMRADEVLDVRPVDD
jgi:hypothetical protein